MQHQYFGGKLTQGQRLLQTGVTCADDNDFLIFQQGTIATGAMTDALASEPLFTRHAQHAIGRTRGNDHRFRLYIALTRGNAPTPADRCDRQHFTHLKLCAGRVGLLLNHRTQIIPSDPSRKSGEVVDFRDGGQMPTRHQRHQHQG